jgi:N-acetylglutamate synthase-like GNAT family acetyltransferase
MAVCNYQVRRATVDDLAALRQLWQHAKLSVSDLEPRWREFQVVETVAGEVLGAIGLHVCEQQGRLYDEAFKDPELAPQLRLRLWERVSSLAHIENLHRLWIAQGSGPFWLEKDFEPPDRAALECLPKTFAIDAPAGWLTTKLRDPAPATRAMEQELALYRVYQQQEAQKVEGQARLLRILAAILTLAVVILVACAGYVIWHHFKMRPIH